MFFYTVEKPPRLSEFDLENTWFDHCKTVGVSAGASTPDDIIDKVINKIKKIGKITEKEVIYDKRFI